MKADQFARLGVRYRCVSTGKSRWSGGKVHLQFWSKEHRQWVMLCRPNFVGAFSGYYTHEIPVTDPTCKVCTKKDPEKIMIWEQTVDGGAFRCWVEPTDHGHRGTLNVQRVATNEIILQQEVSLSYGALFGPDVDDVRYWQQMSIQVIDAWIATQAVSDEAR